MLVNTRDLNMLSMFPKPQNRIRSLPVNESKDRSECFDMNSDTNDSMEWDHMNYGFAIDYWHLIKLVRYNVNYNCEYWELYTQIISR